MIQKLTAIVVDLGKTVNCRRRVVAAIDGGATDAIVTCRVNQVILDFATRFFEVFEHATGVLAVLRD